MMRSTNEQLVLLVGASNVVDNDNEKDKKKIHKHNIPI